MRVTRVKPVPEHLLHLSLMILPLPPQVGHVRIVCTWPNGEFIVTRCWPEPWQVGQVCGCVPGFAPVPAQASQTALRWNLNSLRQPKAASSNVSVRLYCKSLPR